MANKRGKGRCRCGCGLKTTGRRFYPGHGLLNRKEENLDDKPSRSKHKRTNDHVIRYSRPNTVPRLNPGTTEAT